jgi:glycosyltransferase involved in cell wall biosynthesis
MDALIQPVRSGDDAPRLRIALYSGVVFEHDAVSRSFLEKLDLFERLRGAGYPIDVVGFTHGTDYDRSSIRVVPGLLALMRHPEFALADLHIFEFAMWYELFNALLLVTTPTIVVDHNTTPGHLIESPEVRAACQVACLARNNLELATHIVVDGEFTRDQLLDMNMVDDRISVVHLPPSNAFIHPVGTPVGDRSAGPARLLFVGRLVHAKGIFDLLQTVEALWEERGGPDFRLTVAGSLRFSDHETIAAITEVEHRFATDGRFTMVADGNDETIASLYATHDALVMPSYHEGYCVPVIEAMTSGCFVIGSDSGNIPYVMGGLGSTFVAGDLDGMASAIRGFVEALAQGAAPGAEPLLPTSRGPLPLNEWRDAVRRHLATFTHAHYEQELVNVIRGVLAGAGSDTYGWLSEAVDRDVAGLAVAP